MERRWLFTALAALAVTAGPALAEDHAPQPDAAPAPEAPAVTAPAVTAPATDASKAEAPKDTRLALQQPATPPAEEKKSAEAAPPTAPPPKFTYGGQADFYFEHNFNEPFNGKNQIRAFDIFSDKGPHLGLIDLWGQYARDPIGGRIDVDFGTTARLVNAFEPSHAHDFWEHIQQVYVSANLDGKKGKTYVDFGKWVTPAGAEVIEPHDNWLYTRGLLFTWAIPFYHMGGRVYHYFNDTDYVMAAVDRGWNAVGDPDHGPGFILAGSKALDKKWTFTGNYLGGEEVLTTGHAGKSYRNLLDLTLAYNQNAKLSHSLNVDYGQQSSNLWYGFSFMSKYQLTPKSYVSGRVEWLRDDTGALFGTSADAYSFTANYTYIFNKYFQMRGEVREDINGGSPLFLGDNPGHFKKNQGSFLISAIVSY
jgi:hypothetical protein